jgi:ubiquinone/menaquinone biosynthesis C-methylase UbiE
MHSIFKWPLTRTCAPESPMPAAEAYDYWSESYENQTGNLMLDLDELVFSDLLRGISLKNKIVADIGCGTGRHWKKIYEKEPGELMGFDVSAGMLERLVHTYPDAKTQFTTDNRLDSVPDAMIDCLVSTLTIAHIRDIEDALANWSRVLKTGGELLLTDFHPDMLASGGKRTFKYGSRSLSVVNHVHPLDEVKQIFTKLDFTVLVEREIRVSEELRPYYEAQNAIQIYERYKGTPVIYGLHLIKKFAVK